MIGGGTGEAICYLTRDTRTESVTHRRLISISDTGISDWSEPVFDDALLEPICFGSIVACPAGIVFANPAVLERTMPGGPGDRFGPDDRGKIFDRKMLTVHLSDDDCRTWPWARLLERGPSGYSDLAALPDGTLLCLYECDLVERMFDDRYLRLARFNVDWLRGD